MRHRLSRVEFAIPKSQSQLVAWGALVSVNVKVRPDPVALKLATGGAGEYVGLSTMPPATSGVQARERTWSVIGSLLPRGGALAPSSVVAVKGSPLMAQS